MIVPFSEINKKTGNPTFFIEKIWNALDLNDIIPHSFTQYTGYAEEYFAKFGNYWDGFYNEPAKLKIHTLRADEKNRYQPGKLIHPFINNRTKNMFQFAPVFPVVSIQTIQFCYGEIKIDNSIPAIFIDKLRITYEVIQQLAINDGFETVGDFFNWFDEDFTGKIIHFTNFRY